MMKKRWSLLALSLVLLQPASSVPTVSAEETVETVAHTSDWKTFFNLLKDGDSSGRLVSNRRVGDQALTGRVREDINYTGEETVTIEVDEATGIAMAQRQYRYQPNPEKVSRYFVEYINQLRRLNKIVAPLKTQDSVTAFAQAHVTEMLDNMQQNNNFVTYHTNEELVNGQKVQKYKLWADSEMHTPNGLVSYLSTHDFALAMDKEYIYSDQEFAYHAVLSLFSNYGSQTPNWNKGNGVGLVDETYAYRYGILFMDSAYAGVGVGIDHGGNYRATQVFMGETDALGRDGLFYNSSRYYNPSKSGAISFAENGRMLLEGKPVQFLPNTTFKYVYQASKASQPPVVNMVRLYDRKSNQHFYTSNSKEIALLQSRGWRLEGTAWKNSTSTAGTPVYRMWNTKTGERIFTRHQAEVEKFVSFGWKNEGIAFRMPSQGKAIYRLRNNRTGRYLLTVHRSEVDRLIATGQWKNEGTAFYGVS